MTSLFRKRKEPSLSQTPTQNIVNENLQNNTDTAKSQKNIKLPEKEIDGFQTFTNLGIGEWLTNKCNALGIYRPTPVQTHCIPAILSKRNVIGYAQTGSGKTAAFALPILHQLSKDPFGPFALILTPTRELAFQISEQFQAFGTSIGLRDCVIVGGVDILEQSMELKKRPHVITATPGRFRDHLLRSDPPDVSKLNFFVLDEADRLFEKSFSSDLEYILNHINSNRQTLLFSATMVKDEEKLKKFGVIDAVEFCASEKDETVKTLTQNYIFLPHQLKTCYLVYVLLRMVQLKHIENKELVDNEEEEEEEEKARLAIVFVSTCKIGQLLGEILREMNVSCSILHSMMSQKRRFAALGKFRSGVDRLLICTDVCSRGLDIPSVDLVINYDIPRKTPDYIHRVGRTARAGRKGRALSLVTQYDIDLLLHIEKTLDTKLTSLDSIKENKVLPLLNQVTTATRVAKMKLAEYGFDEKAIEISNRRKKQRQQKGN